MPSALGISEIAMPSALVNFIESERTDQKADPESVSLF